MRPGLRSLAPEGDFIGRHIGLSEADETEMLTSLGLDSLDELTEKTVPSAIRDDAIGKTRPLTEESAIARLRAMARRNVKARSFIGMGYHGTVTPPVILRNVLENPGWYTAYTPYQAEISQGRMEALLNYQQMVIDLTGMEIANASLLDEATAAAEAVTFMRRVGKHKGEAVFVDGNCHPQTIAVIQTRCEPLAIPMVVGDPFKDLDPAVCFGCVLQYPGTDGAAPDFSSVVEDVHAARGLVTVAADPLSLVLLTPPGEWGADVVVGTTQRFGVPMGLGGPHAAYFATRDAFKRQMPGRLIGLSVDSRGKPALRMALQTREQHIRREKATSNICTAQVLLANIAGFYAVYHGPDGLTRIARRVHRLTALLAAGLRDRGVDLLNGAFFDTVTIRMEDAPARVLEATKHGYNLRLTETGRIGVTCDETTTASDIDTLLGFFGEGPDTASLDATVEDALPAGLVRKSPFLTHPVFHMYRSETAMMRYLRHLEGKDLALNQAMIPLGSCTMKLNAAAEMIPITFPGFSGVHPFAPQDQTLGYKELIDDLEARLRRITGFHAISFQPNAGSQGEYAGLLCIRAYLKARGETNRTICLIPSSAHGTNPASAVMAGMRVVVVSCDEAGNVDMEDLAAKIGAHRETLAALMVTYPSTHGVFEETIGEICGQVHAAGGQVYMDGANLQAMVELCRPGQFGPDVAHMNLHKTFCIPHGGGGPGVGPIGVAKHLAPYLPNHPLRGDAGPETGLGAVAAAPWGSASILPISWAYIAMMGDAGLRRATQVSILSANYIAHRLKDYYPTLYKGRNGLVAHECILDTRVLRDSHGVTVDDVAKRLIDYGFHAPTMSWPVAGTLMVEPTESEPKAELDRFCDAMISIAKEAAKVGAGDWPADDNPLVNSPHPADQVTADDWDHAYSREVAAYPAAALRQAKFWAPVGRVDNAAGDRNVVCACPPLEVYQDAAE